MLEMAMLLQSDTPISYLYVHISRSLKRLNQVSETISPAPKSVLSRMGHKQKSRNHEPTQNDTNKH
jgi:hypothetical protein